MSLVLDSMCLVPGGEEAKELSGFKLPQHEHTYHVKESPPCPAYQMADGPVVRHIWVPHE